MGESTQRLFFALWPDAAIRARLLATIPPTSEAGRAIPADNLHITLAFLGDVAEARMPELMTLGASIRGAEFAMLLGRIEVWNRALVCLVPQNTPAELSALAAELQNQLARSRFPVDEREYRPHVTLIRERKRGQGRRKSLMEGVRDGDAIAEPVAWRVREFVLVRSRPGAGGSSYEVLASWPLH